MTTDRLTEDEALAIFERGEGFDTEHGENTALGDLWLALEEWKRAEAALNEAVRAGHKQGLSWTDIGHVVGLSNQGARERYRTSQPGLVWHEDGDATTENLSIVNTGPKPSNAILFGSKYLPEESSVKLITSKLFDEHLWPNPLPSILRFSPFVRAAGTKVVHKKGRAKKKS